jgi:LysM repeat protein
MMFVLVVSAIFCAVATFIVISLVDNRSLPASSAVIEYADQVVIDGVSINLNRDPEKAVVIVGEPMSTSVPAYPEQVDNTASPTHDQVSQEPAEVTVPHTATPVPDPIILVDYLVQPGDSLYSIGVDQNSSIELMSLYNIGADDIVAGNLLALPIANQAYCFNNRAYVVRDHDTIYGIARAFNTSSEAIMMTNGFQPGQIIKVTEVICIPYP